MKSLLKTIITIPFTMLLSHAFTVSHLGAAPETGGLGFQHLKGIRYISLAVEYNEVLFAETYVDELEEKFKPFNLDLAAKKLKNANIPLDKNHIRKTYESMAPHLEKTDLRLLKLRHYMEEPSTVVPTLTARVWVRELAPKQYIGVVHLTLEKWISNWSGTERILAPAYIWSAKKLFSSSPDQLGETIQASVTELMKIFVSELALANRVVPEENAPPGEEGKKGKSRE